MATHITSIRFTVDKNGKRRAHYWGLARRWLPISVTEAEFKLATSPERYVQNEVQTLTDVAPVWNAESARRRVGGTFGT